MTDPMQQIAKLGRLLAEAAAGLGLDQQTFMVVPDVNNDKGVHVIQAMFLLPAEVDPDMDAISGILEATAKDERTRLRELAAEADARKVEERRDEVLEAQRLLDEGRSFLDE